jgi:hypothetical protein
MIRFKKISAVLGTLLMTGLTLGTAAAASYPAPFMDDGVADVAIVYGTGTGVSSLDYAQAQAIQTSLAGSVESSSSVVHGEVYLTDDEVTLGGLITGGDINSPITDSKLETLKDEKFTWDDGAGSDDYNIHEEITIGTMKVLTSIDDKKLEGVALSNEQALEYKFVFDDQFNYSAVGGDEADTLYLEIMGEEYEIESMGTDSITVTTSDEVSMGIGDTYSLEGKTVSVVDIFDGSVEVSVDGQAEVIDLDDTEKVEGIRINVKSVGYHSNTPETSKVILKIGVDISKSYTSGDEYIGEDDDDPLWVWDIANLDAADGYIGVKYNAKIDSANDEIAGDSIKYVGEGYVLPGDFAAVTLDSLTDAAYQDLKFYFEDSEDLFAAADGSTAFAENKPVLVVEAEDTDILTTGGQETDKLYLYYNTTDNAFQTFYRDFDGDYTPTNYMRLANSSVNTVSTVTMNQTEFATLQIGDTDLDLDIEVIAGVGYLTLTNDDDSNNEVIYLKIGGDEFNSTAGTGTIESLGTTAEDAEAEDITFDGTDVSTEDYSYMDHYGILLSDGATVQDEADADEATLSIPEEQVYAQVTVSLGAVTESEASTLDVLAKDTEVSSVQGKNLIIVGGSCINSAAATVLGGAYCGAAFTSATGVGASQFLIKGFEDAYTTGKLALVVAGYDAADTVNAATYLTTKKPDTSSEWIGTSATEATVVAETA